MSRDWQLDMLIMESGFKNNMKENITGFISSIGNPSTKIISCYDDYYCNNNDLANAGHVLLGVFGLLLTLAGLILNILLIPVMSLVGIRSSATYYMIAMAISDSCLVIIDLILVVIRYLPSNQQIDQLLMYQSFVAYLVPFGFPAKSVCQILTLSLCAGLIFDRGMYLRIQNKPKDCVKSTIAIKIIVSLTTFAIVTKLPNFLLLKIVENYDIYSTFISVRWTLLAKPWIFIFDLVLFLGIYLILLASVLYLSYLASYNHFIPHLNLKKRFEVPPEQRVRRRERLYLGMGLVIGILTCFLKFPHLLRYVFFGFEPNNRDESQRYNLVVVDMWMEIMDLLLVTLKPMLYLFFAAHFRQALKDMIGLWVRPSHYSELKVSGGMGKVINLRDNKICRSDTADTLLRCGNSDNKLNENIYATPYSNNISLIQALAVEQVLKPKTPSNNFDSTPSGSFISSAISVTSCQNSEFQSSSLKT